MLAGIRVVFGDLVLGVVAACRGEYQESTNRRRAASVDMLAGVARPFVSIRGTADLTTQARQLEQRVSW